MEYLTHSFLYLRIVLPKSCLEVFQRGRSQPDGMYNLLAADGSHFMAYCDISGGGWTRVFSNSFTKNDAGVTFKIDCPCGSNAALNNGANAISSLGWHLGVSNCHDGNKLSDKMGNATIGTVVNHIGHNHGAQYDGKYPHFWTSSWSAQIGTTTWKKGEGNYYVYQVRGKAIIWSGKMTMWETPNSPVWGTKNKAVGHARRTSGAAAGQWQVGDIMFFREADALKMGAVTTNTTTAKYSWRMDFHIPDYGPATAVRHTGINQNEHGYDHTAEWPEGASPITSNVLMSDGEFASAYKAADGTWRWFAKYNLGAFDIMTEGASVAPYFTYLYSGGGAVGCDESNSDGFDTKDWEIYAMVGQAPTAPGMYVCMYVCMYHTHAHTCARTVLCQDDSCAKTSTSTGTTSSPASSTSTTSSPASSTSTARLSTVASTTSAASKATTSTLLKAIQASTSTLHSGAAFAKSVTANPGDHSTRMSEYYPLVAMACVSLIVVTGIVGGIVYAVIRKTAKRSERNYQVQMDTDGGDVHAGSDIIAEGQVIDVIDGNDMSGPDDHTS